MDAAFWQDRWAKQHLGFHQTTINPHLQRHWRDLALPSGGAVFVPLCGKSLDMCWLADQGHTVIGVELSERAIHDFFDEQQIHPRQDRHGGGVRWSSSDGRYLLWQADIFHLPSLAREEIAQCSAIYDRAALIALPVLMRAEFVVCLEGVFPQAVSQLLLVLEYDQSKMNGPPFSVTEQEIHSHYGHRYHVQRVMVDYHPEGISRFQERGVHDLCEKALVLSPRESHR